MQVTFEPEPRRQYLKLLGYDTDELSKKVHSAHVHLRFNPFPTHIHGCINIHCSSFSYMYMYVLLFPPPLFPPPPPLASPFLFSPFLLTSTLFLPLPPLPAAVLNMVKDECLHTSICGGTGCPGALPETLLHLHPRSRGGEGERRVIEGGVRDQQHCSNIWIRGRYVCEGESGKSGGREVLEGGAEVVEVLEGEELGGGEAEGREG